MMAQSKTEWWLIVTGLVAQTRQEYSLTPQEFRWLLEGLSIDQPKAVKKIEIGACI